MIPIVRPKIPPMIPMTAPNNPATKPKKTAIKETQIGKVKIRITATNKLEEEEERAISWGFLLSQQ